MVRTLILISFSSGMLNYGLIIYRDGVLLVVQAAPPTVFVLRSEAAISIAIPWRERHDTARRNRDIG